LRLGTVGKKWRVFISVSAFGFKKPVVCPLTHCQGAVPQDSLGFKSYLGGVLALWVIYVGQLYHAVSNANTI